MLSRLLSRCSHFLPTSSHKAVTSSERERESERASIWAALFHAGSLSGFDGRPNAPFGLGVPPCKRRTPCNSHANILSKPYLSRTRFIARHDNAHLLNNPDIGISTEADNANEQIDPGSRMGHSSVMLSAAKHLAAQRDRPFARSSLHSSLRALRACSSAQTFARSG